MECITCALCIDACDEVMAKIGRPRGLIDYLALDDEPPAVPGDRAAVRPLTTDAEAAPSVTLPVEGNVPPAPHAAAAPAITVSPTEWRPQPVWKHVFRPRTMIYTTAWAAIGLFLLVSLFVRPDIDLTVAPVRNPTFVTLSDGSIRNAYDLRLRNKHGETRPFHISLTAQDALRIELEGEDALTTAVPADSTKLQRVYVTARPGDPAAERARSDLRLWVEDLVSGERAFRDTTFNGRESFDERSGAGA